MTVDKDGYKKALKDDKALAIFLRAMSQFDRYFCELMNDNKDFTLRLEVRGVQGKLIHCRVTNDGFERPAGVKAPRKVGETAVDTILH